MHNTSATKFNPALRLEESVVCVLCRQIFCILVPIIVTIGCCLENPVRNDFCPPNALHIHRSPELGPWVGNNSGGGHHYSVIIVVGTLNWPGNFNNVVCFC